MLRKGMVTMVVVLCVTSLEGFDPATHLYVASQTFDVWQSFDQSFYNALTSSDDSLRITTRKFYYIGILLPDMVDTFAQRGEREVIERLDSLPQDTTISISYTVDLFGLIRIPVVVHGTVRQRKWSPLIITEETSQNVQTPIIFNGALPNKNFQKLYEMALYARSQGWSAADKAVIYGALMHVIQDLVAHMVLQPSLYGYRYTVEADSMLVKGLLEYFESYHEILAQTYITDWSAFSELFIPYVYHDDLGFEGYAWYVPSYFRPHYSFYTYLHINNQNYPNDPGNYQTNWQEYDFMPVRRFVEAVIAKGYMTGNVSTLQERLEAYMYGWSILIYALYHGDIGGNNLGAIFRNPDWNAEDIFVYLVEPALDCIYVTDVWVEGDAGHLGDNLTELLGNGLIYAIELFVDPVSMFSDKLVEDPLFFATRIFYLANGIEHWNYPWTFFLSPSGVDEIYSVFGSDTVYVRELKLIRREVGYWYTYADWPPPYRREFYAKEQLNAMAMGNVYTDILLGGPSSLDYWAWPLARKAGVLGGIDTLPDTTYYQQPGVVRLQFERENNLIYTTQDIEREGPATYLKLSYDLVTFGGTKVEIK